MKVRPTLEELQAYKKAGYTCVPVSAEMFADVRTPIEVLRILKRVSGHCYLLESAEEHERWGRYTFLGYDPKLELTCQDGTMKVGSLTFEAKHPDTCIRQVLSEHVSPKLEYLPPFTGGLVGYFSYDYLKYAEPTLRLDAKDTEGFKDVDLMLFDKVIAFDHYRQKIVLMVNAMLSEPETEYNRAVLELGHMQELILHGEPIRETGGRIGESGAEADGGADASKYTQAAGRDDASVHEGLSEGITALFTEDEYCAMVEKARHHIFEGDIFQIVLSNRLEAPFTGSLLDTYRTLRTVNPSPYMFYFSSADLEVAGASPETLVKLEDGVLHTFPLAGTRPRGKTPQEDEALEQELLADPKELAEHSMLVDLGRNDLGKISEFGSVVVESAYNVLRYSHVMHIGSTVRGTIRKDKDALDAIGAVLPAGTLSGAPKIMACQLINDLENNKRGIYGGAIGYISFTGNMDTCIGIRLAYKKNGKVFVRSGAGIVADSVPEKEYRECINKAAAVVRSLQAAGEAG